MKKKIEKAWLGKVLSKEKKKKEKPHCSILETLWSNQVEHFWSDLWWVFPLILHSGQGNTQKKKIFWLFCKSSLSSFGSASEEGFLAENNQMKTQPSFNSNDCPSKGKRVASNQQNIQAFVRDQCHLNKIVFVALEVGGTYFI